MGGVVVRPTDRDEPWSIRLLDQPTPLEVVHAIGSDLHPVEGVVQQRWPWPWVSSVDNDSIRLGKEEQCLATMRVTFLDDKGWTVLALNSAHIIGISIFTDSCGQYSDRSSSGRRSSRPFLDVPFRSIHSSENISSTQLRSTSPFEIGCRTSSSQHRCFKTLLPLLQAKYPFLPFDRGLRAFAIRTIR
jgi:hypothetical protein